MTNVPEGARPRRLAVLCGISNYESDLPPLVSIDGELDDLKAVLQYGLHPAFCYDQVRVYRNSDVTLPRLTNLLRELAKPSPIDEILFLLAGHGLKVDGRTYFATYGGTTPPGIDGPFLSGRLYELANTKKIFGVLDFCHAGSVADGIAWPPNLAVLASSQSEELSAAGSQGDQSFTRHFVSALTEAPPWENGVIYWGSVGMYVAAAMSRSLRQRPVDRGELLRLHPFNEGPRRNVVNLGMPESKPRYPSLLFRRRCRVVTAGSTAFRSQFYSLATERAPSDLRISAAWDWKGYEDVMLRAAILESEGKAEEFEALLKSRHFKGEFEVSRRFYWAVALEKNGLLPEALTQYNWILQKVPPQSEIALAADFNRRLCFEKLNRFDEADFSIYIADIGLQLSTGEMMWHKALCNQLVYCAKSGRPFNFLHLFDRAMAEEVEAGPSGAVKLLLNWVGSRGELLAEKDIDDLLVTIERMGVTGRVGALYQVASQLDRLHRPEVALKLRKEIERLAALSGSELARRFLH